MMNISVHSVTIAQYWQGTYLASCVVACHMTMLKVFIMHFNSYMCGIYTIEVIIYQCLSYNYLCIHEYYGDCTFAQYV